MIQLTRDDVKHYPANYIYVWASDSYLAQLEPKYATVIRGKKANQKKLLSQIAVPGFDATNQNDVAKYNALLNEVKASFVEKYGMTPKEALVVLAEGGTVAGKNYASGTFGIGKTNVSRRSNFSQNTGITVNPETGIISHNGVAQECTEVYGKDGSVQYQNCEIDGATYSSWYDKDTKKFYAYQYAPGGGNVKYSATGEKILFGDMTENMWQDVMGITSQFGDWLLGFLQALSNIFNWPPKGETPKTTETPPPLTSKNTLPNQGKDGYARNAKTNLGIIAIAGAAAALLLWRRRK